MAAPSLRERGAFSGQLVDEVSPSLAPTMCPVAARNCATAEPLTASQFLLPLSDATARLELGLRRNQFRFGNRGGEDDEVDSFATVWPRVLRHLLSALGAADALTIANRLMESGVLAVRDRAA